MFYKGVQNVIFKKLVNRRQHTILALETFNSGVCDAAVDCRLSTSSRRFNCNAAKHKPTRFKQAGNHFHTQRRVNVKSKAGAKMGWRLPYNAQIVLNFLYACSCRQPSIVSVYRAGLNQFKCPKSCSFCRFWKCRGLAWTSGSWDIESFNVLGLCWNCTQFVGRVHFHKRSVDFGVQRICKYPSTFLPHQIPPLCGQIFFLGSDHNFDTIAHKMLNVQLNV